MTVASSRLLYVLGIITAAWAWSCDPIHSAIFIGIGAMLWSLMTEVVSIVAVGFHHVASELVELRRELKKAAKTEDGERGRSNVC